MYSLYQMTGQQGMINLRGCGGKWLIHDTIPEFTWRDWAKTSKTSVTIASVS